MKSMTLQKPFQLRLLVHTKYNLRVYNELNYTWNMVAAGSNWHTVTSVTLIWPVYMKCSILAIAVGQTPCNFTRDISHSLRPPVNIA